jgi:hypothetical protein
VTRPDIEAEVSQLASLGLSPAEVHTVMAYRYGPEWGAWGPRTTSTGFEWGAGALLLGGAAVVGALLYMRAKK